MKTKEALNFLRKFYRTKGYPCTVRELGKAMGLKSSSAPYYHVKKLRKMGLISTKSQGNARVLVPVIRLRPRPPKKHFRPALPA